MKARLLILLLLAGCIRLDDNLLSPGADISEYKLDGYTGEVDFQLDSSYNVTVYTFLDLHSRAPGESQSTRINALYIGDTSRIGIDTVILYCHGYNHHIDFYWNRVKLLANVGGKHRFGVLILDYRGYGLSDGSPTEEGLYADADAAVAWLQNKGLAADRFVMYGFSLGGVPAIELTADPRTLKPRWLIIESAFASAELLAQDAVRLAVPGSFFTNVNGDNAAKMPKVDQPLLHMHGEEDAFLSFETHARELRENYKGSALVPIDVEDADHDNVPKVMGFDAYRGAILDFLLSH